MNPVQLAEALTLSPSFCQLCFWFFYLDPYVDPWDKTLANRMPGTLVSKNATLLPSPSAQALTLILAQLAPVPLTTAPESTRRP